MKLLDSFGRQHLYLRISVTDRCNYRCVYCMPSEGLKWKPKQDLLCYEEIARLVHIFVQMGIRHVRITGGEPTIHPRFIDALRLAKKLGMRTSIGTIGTRLCKEEFAQQALPFLDEALFSIHGPQADVHDTMTRRKGSFERVTAAMKMVVRLRPDFGAYVNTVLTRMNQEYLPETVAMADAMGAKLIVVSNTTPEGGGMDNYKDLAVSLEDLRRILPLAVSSANNSILRFFGIPMCLLGEHASLSNDLHWDPRVTVEWQAQKNKVVFGGEYSWSPDRKRIHAPVCQDCSRSKVCMGVFEEYTRIWPVDALQPYSV